MAIINFLTLWIQDIVIVFILISIMGIIIPNGSMKRYIDMITGFLIIIIIISPLTRLMHTNLDIDGDLLKSPGIQTEFEYGDELNRIQHQQIEEIYKIRIEDEVMELIDEHTEYEMADLRVSIYEDEERYGAIKNMEVDLKKGSTEREGSKGSIQVGNIENITIGDDGQRKSVAMEIDDSRLQDIISSRYGIAKENIKIFLSTSGEDGLNEEGYRDNKRTDGAIE